MNAHKNEISKTTNDMLTLFNLTSENSSRENHLVALRDNEGANIKREVKRTRGQTDIMKEKVFELEVRFTLLISNFRIKYLKNEWISEIYKNLCNLKHTN